MARSGLSIGAASPSERSRAAWCRTAFLSAGVLRPTLILQKVGAKAILFFNNQDTSFNYMDSYVADLCTELTNDLRDAFGRNIWFDLKDGIFYFFVVTVQLVFPSV